MIQLEVVRPYDAAQWQVAAPLPQPGVTFLLTWTVVPHPEDAGIPAAVGHILAEALLDQGDVLFGGESDASEPVVRVPVRRGIRRDFIAVVAAHSRDDVMPAFSCPHHDWSQNAQWLVVAPGAARLSGDAVTRIIRRLYQDWALPEPWPVEIAVIVQAAVDGDGAACHCRDAATAEQVLDGLRRGASAIGATLVAADTQGGTPAA
jgi:hypothetical protein